MITDVSGIQVGHWTDAEARTGTTVVVFPEGTTASAEVRGGAPASRELDLLAPERLVDRLDALVLTGGSAFGLAAADGVMNWLGDAGRGVATPAGPVPIVTALALYDLAVGDPNRRPGPVEGRMAAESARPGAHAIGPVGAGTGCTTGTWHGPDAARPGGLVTASATVSGATVGVLLAVNAAGSVDPDGSAARRWLADPAGPAAVPFTNTTIGLVATDARVDKTGCLLLAQSAHDGLARALFPAHTSVDGDAVVAAATGQVDADLSLVRPLATALVEQAIATLGAYDRSP